MSTLPPRRRYVLSHLLPHRPQLLLSASCAFGTSGNTEATWFSTVSLPHSCWFASAAVRCCYLTSSSAARSPWRRRPLAHLLPPRAALTRCSTLFELAPFTLDVVSPLKTPCTCCCNTYGEFTRSLDEMNTSNSGGSLCAPPGEIPKKLLLYSRPFCY
jgi:hypothetical protein